MDQALFARQQRMKALGVYTGMIDGEDGPRTQAAYDALVAIAERAAGIEPPKYPRLTSQHAYLRSLYPLPLVISAALDLLGTVEVPGRASSPIIDGWRDELNIPRGIYSDDSVPWCGLLAGVCAKRVGKDIAVLGPPAAVLWARNWARFGEHVDKDSPMLGDVLVWPRGSGGHVNFYVGESVEGGVRYFHGVGGNQGDAVNIMKKRAAQVLAVRRPIYRNRPSTVKAYRAGSGAAISEREA